MEDIKARESWEDYTEAYEEMVQNTASKQAPWFVIPADNKWYARMIVACAIVEALEELDLAFPDVDKEKKKELESIKEALLAEKD
jgi:polyphosphate kinase 2 (PPK2 family)